MPLLQLKDRFLATPWVYDCLRPFVVGGIDHAELARFCRVRPDDRVFDLGCGTGQMVPHLGCAAYLGADLDRKAIERAARYAGPHVRFVCGDQWDAPLSNLRPTLVLMIGVVHHLPDSDFLSLLDRLHRSESLRRIVTLDVSYFPGRWVNNALSRLDRGRHVRSPDQYAALFRAAGLRIGESGILTTRLRYVQYIGYHLARGAGA
jgi:SAM-dependent methyltransferase